MGLIVGLRLVQPSEPSSVDRILTIGMLAQFCTGKPIEISGNDLKSLEIDIGVRGRRLIPCQLSHEINLWNVFL